MSAHELKEGDPAPEIALDDDTSKPVKLSGFRGKTVVLYFYPKADTPGCTKESCEFRDTSTKFTRHDAVILGISPDKAAAQASSRPNIICHSPCWPMWITKLRKRTACGRKNPCTGRSTWVLNDRPL